MAARRNPNVAAMATQAKMSASPSDPWTVAYFVVPGDGPRPPTVPAKDYLWQECPAGVAAFFSAVIAQVAAAPPPRFAGGGYWEAMHGDLTGFHEIRKKYRGMNYRIFCRLDAQSLGTPPLLTLLCGRTKPDRTVFSTADYREVLQLGQDYLSSNPRSVVF